MTLPLCRSGEHRLEEANQELSHDPADAGWDYFREDSLLHVFHSLLHKVWDAIKDNGRFSRTFELFFYTHQQLLRRAAIEREIGKVLKKKKNSIQGLGGLNKSFKKCFPFF